MNEMEHDRLTRVEERANSNTDRIEKMEKSLNDYGKLVTSVALLAEKQSNMEKDVGEIKEAVKGFALKPAKLWEKIIEKAILVFVAAIVTYVVVKVGLG